MALKSKVNFCGVEIENAYVYVSQFSGNKTDLTAQVSFCVPDNKSNSFQVKEYSVAYVLESANPIQQIYESLKTLPEFINAKDC